MAKPANVAQPLTAAARLRKRLEDQSDIIACPGVYDGYTARVALRQGFDALYMAGAGASMSVLGQADLGIATPNDLTASATMIASLDRQIPLIADADTGGTGSLQTRRLVHSYINGGVAALHIEDQVLTKRCGHLAHKEIVDDDIFISRIRAAVLAREEIPGGDIVIIARTDPLQSLGYDAAIQRLKRAVAAGADVAFMEGLTSLAQMRSVCKDLAPTPVLLNMVSAGVTPDTTVAEAREMGFQVIIFPGAACTRL